MAALTMDASGGGGGVLQAAGHQIGEGTGSVGHGVGAGRRHGWRRWRSVGRCGQDEAAGLGAP
ncbi:hypothetical protein E2562_019925 [Oryza meyeriana var. granulata]|uniref:Uncharacterized protein n=1 Tax=Oryza meyeriana var. granulata TaxID=110450 RepID=A0A6G1EXI7_9ORYZ|nr:hypothetical protein E2562_019925 [Oryza meyeriana var. granulata]